VSGRTSVHLLEVADPGSGRGLSRRAREPPVLPLDRQLRYSAGLLYDLNERITMGLAYTFLDAGSASVNQTRGPSAGTIQGDFSSNYIHVVALNVAMRF
jgi:long-subunit fatty acid transport protein